MENWRVNEEEVPLSNIGNIQIRKKILDSHQMKLMKNAKAFIEYYGKLIENWRKNVEYPLNNMENCQENHKIEE